MARSFLILLSLSCMSCVCLASPRSSLGGWEEWKAKHGKAYSHSEEITRRGVWYKNKAFIEEHNARQDVTYQLGLNAFADQDVSEQLRHNAFQDKPLFHHLTKKVICTSHTPDPRPTSFDWRTKGVVPSVSNQGQLGASQVLTVEKSIESLNTISTGRLAKGSTSEVLQCCYKRGASGGDVLTCVINQLHGLCLEQDYPKTRNGSCAAAMCQPKLKVKGFDTLTSGDEEQLQLELLQTPVVVTINAGLMSFQLYRSGIYSDKKCGPTLNHSMLLVGYGVANLSGENVEYWVLQNTWGVAWGEQGYIRIARNQGNMCGIASGAFRPC